MGTTIEVQPNSIYDENYWTDTFFFTGVTAVYIGFPITREPYRTALFFPSVDVPKMAQINSAYLSLYSPAAQSDVVNVYIYSNYAPIPEAPDSIEAGDALTLTTKYIEWSLTSAWAEGWVTTPDITSIIQPQVDHPGWARGNPMQVVFLDRGTTFYNSRRWRTYGYNPSLASKLTIEYQLQRTVTAEPKILVNFNVLGLLVVTSMDGGLLPSSVKGR